MKRPLIFVTNDDGVNAKGISELISVAQSLGDVLVVAPDGARSGQSSALTVNMPITYKTLKETDALTVLSCTGTPVDCVKLGFSGQLKDYGRMPDILFSGINHGSNSAINVIYSGTMGAAIEGALYKVPSIGFSLCNHDAEADFSQVLDPFAAIASKVISDGLPAGICLNVNAPMGDIAGIRTTRQSGGCWRKEYMSSPMPYGNRVSYWLTGEFQNEEPEADDTDEWALEHGFVSVQPVHTDMTHYETLKKLQF